jgi:hypothetical protein
MLEVKVSIGHSIGKHMWVKRETTSYVCFLLSNCRSKAGYGGTCGKADLQDAVNLKTVTDLYISDNCYL